MNTNLVTAASSHQVWLKQVIARVLRSASAIMQHEYDVARPLGIGDKWLTFIKRCQSRLLCVLRHSLWVFLLPFSILLCASQPLPQQDLNLIKRAEQTYGTRAGKRVTSWRMLVMETKGTALSEVKKLERVNNFFNQMRFVDDIRLWRKKDYWATPLEFLGAAGGDCEDFSVAKYATLLELGIPDDKMRMVYVKALDYNQFHMVVAYYETPSSVPVILDNLIGSIRPATQRRDLVPIYSFNGSHLWLMKARGQGELAGQSSRLGLWNDLRNRMTSGRLARPVVNLDD